MIHPITTSLQEWGDSLAIRIPESVARELRLCKGDALRLVVTNNSLVVVPDTTAFGGRLEDLLAGVTAENIPTETDDVAPIGKELW